MSGELEIEKILRGFYATVQPAVITEAESYCFNHGVSDDDFRHALTAYRMDDANSRRFCPTIWDLVPYLPKRAQQPRTKCRGSLRCFWSLVEGRGWPDGLRYALHDDARLAQLFAELGVTEVTPPYAEELLLPESGRWYAEYLRILHIERDHLKACRHAAQYAPDGKTQGYFRKKSERLAMLTPEELDRSHEYLRRTQREAMECEVPF